MFKSCLKQYILQTLTIWDLSKAYYDVIEQKNATKRSFLQKRRFYKQGVIVLFQKLSTQITDNLDSFQNIFDIREPKNAAVTKFYRGTLKDVMGCH